MKPIPFGPWIRGVDASTGVLSQPKGSVPRASNLLLTKRGSLKTCDGSAIVNAYNGLPTINRGRDLCDFLYKPTGVAPYYLRIMKALDQHLGAPQNLSLTDAGTGGTLSGTYFYKVTALDNIGGETTASAEQTITVAASHKVTLQWNVVPNAVSYNVYRSTTTGTESILIGADLPVAQVALGTTTVSFTDTGADTSPTFNVGSIIDTLFHGVPTNLYTLTLLAPLTLTLGTSFVYAAGSNAALNGTYTLNNQPSSTVMIVQGPSALNLSSTLGTITIAQSPPLTDTTQQTGLYAMPPAANGIVYTNANLVALFPADVFVYPDGVPGGGGPLPGPGGGSGGGPGGGSSGGQTQQGTTPSGGAPGNVSLLPQIVQFTNQAAIALGNGFPPQVYSDPNGTTVNPAKSVAIASIAVDANGVVTITTSTPHGIDVTQGNGANVILAGITNALYNSNGNGASCFPTIHITSPTVVEIVNLSVIGQAASSGGTLTVSTIPILSTFVPSYPSWTASVSYAVNSIVVPAAPNGHYYRAIQGGTSGSSTPTFPTTTGGQIADGQVIWRESGLLNSAAPPPPGCAHVVVYAGSLWMFNTSPANTATGLDGPTSLRMSDVNNLNSWNPVNQAFLDKDDGTEGMGLASFTITAQGIPPQGSLAAFKQFATYQIIGVFGSATFAIQRVQTDMGLIAPRTLQFVPGFGLLRMTHLGYSVFDGVTDRVVSPQIQPYLFVSDDSDTSDIVPMDSVGMALSQSAQTANPPMYVSAIPVGAGANGNLTRLLCFDLVLKAWSIVDLPFPISAMSQARSTVAAVVTLLGSANDGTLQRWQASDTTWATGVSPTQRVASTSVAWNDTTFDNQAEFVVASSAGFALGDVILVQGNSNPFFNVYGQITAITGTQINIFIPGTAAPQTGTGGTISLVGGPVSGFMRTPTLASKDAYVRLYAREVIVRGQQGSPAATLSVNPRVAGVSQGLIRVPTPLSGDIQIAASVTATHDRFDADIFFSGQLTIDAIAWDVVPKPAGVLAGAIS